MLRLQNQMKALKSEVLKAITGESTFDTDLLKEMLEENKRSQAETEQIIMACQDEVKREEDRIAQMATQYESIRDWAEQFDRAEPDTQKMILARLIEKITVDRDYNIEIHFFVTLEDFLGREAAGDEPSASQPEKGAATGWTNPRQYAIIAPEKSPSEETGAKVRKPC